MKQRIFRTVMAFLLVFSICVGLLPPAFAGSGQVTFTGIDTLMIYNPMMDYEDMYSYGTLSTGNMYGQIKRADGNFSNGFSVGEDIPFRDIGPQLQQDLKGFTPVISGPAVETESFDRLMSEIDVGATKTFFYWPDKEYQEEKAEFTCLYVGEHCLVWGYEFSDKTMAQTLGEEFDDLIYENNTEYFGTGRFVKDGAKLNILVYTMSSSGTAGFFWGMELYSEEDIGSEYASIYNLGMPIIHLNTSICTHEDDMFTRYGATTVAHEYQHLICMSSTMFGSGYWNGITMGVWLNEAMAKEAEELNYPGMVVYNNYVAGSYNGSYDIAGGQSLYNFTTYYDIGVYGQGFLFSEYIKQLHGGAGVFKKLHDHWRAAEEEELTDAKALYEALPESIRTSILDQLEYPAAVTGSFDGEEEEFLSKLALAFHVAGALKKSDGIYGMPETCEEASPKLYTDSGCDIECGGRIFVKTADGDSYTVPSDADSKLIYVGFKNGEMVIAPTTAEGYLSSSFTVQAVSNDPAMGTVSVSGNVITGSPAEGCGYDAPAWTVLSGTAQVEKKGDTFTVYAEEDCTVQINFRRRSQTVDVWDGSVADSVPVSGNVYMIGTCAQLAKLAQMVNGGEKLAGKTVQLTNDLDLNGHQWMPIGSGAGFCFSGSFEGNGYTISGLTIGTADAPRTGSHHGLFGYISGEDSVICDLTLDEVSVYGKTYVGAIAGTCNNAALVNCSVSGTAGGDSYVGLLLGYGGTLDISHCGTVGTVTAATTNAGGLAASLQKTAVSQCWSGADVTGTSYVGGLAGRLNGGMMADCYSRGDVSGSTSVGGVVGISVGSSAVTGAVSVANCYWAGRLTADSSKGAIVGSYLGELSCTSCYYEKYGCSYAVADGTHSGVTALDLAEMQNKARFSGWDFAKVWNISQGANSGYPILRWQTFDVSRVVIRGERHWLYPGETMQLTLMVIPDVAKDTSYTVTSSNPAVVTVSDTGLVTAKAAGEAVITLTANSNGLQAFYDVAVITQEQISGGFAGGSGTESDPYIVNSKADLEHLARITNCGYSFSGEYICQTADIALNGSKSDPWTPIGKRAVTPFSGVYNGGGHQVTGLYINDMSASLSGLFGSIYGGSLLHLDLDDSTVMGGSSTGAFVGQLMAGTLLDCCTLSGVTVSGTHSQGGIVGVVFDDQTTSTVSFCSNEGTVIGGGAYLMPHTGGVIGNMMCSGTSAVTFCRNLGTVVGSGSGTTTGGITGMADGCVVGSCYNSGAVTGNGPTGGISGYLQADVVVQDCYNAGEIRNNESSSGGIVGTTNEGSLVVFCINLAPVSANLGIHSIVGSCFGDMRECFYLSGRPADSKAVALTAEQLKNETVMAGYGLDLANVWCYAEGENEGYPVLRVFQPSVSIPADSFDKYTGQDITVTFALNGNVLTGLLGVDDQFMTVTSEAGACVLTVSEDYLTTLPVGTHTLYARFAGHCIVPFTVEVTDSAPAEYEVLPTEVWYTDSTTLVKLTLSAPEETAVTLVLAAYRGGRLESVNALTETLACGTNKLELTLDITIEAGLQYVVFLATEAGYIPLTDDVGFTVNVPSSASAAAGETLQARILSDKAI